MPVVIPSQTFPPATGTPQTVPVDLPTPSFVNDCRRTRRNECPERHGDAF